MLKLLFSLEFPKNLNGTVRKGGGGEHCKVIMTFVLEGGGQDW